MRWLALSILLLACAPDDLEDDDLEAAAPLGKADSGGGSLRDQLYEELRGHRSLGYDRARDVLFGELDVDETGEIECAYTGRRTRPDGTRTPGDFNTEHAWPQSRGASREPARSDLHHLFAVDERANSARGSFRFGETACSDASRCRWRAGGSELGDDAAGALVFEVRPDRRGDLARSQLYFAVRYRLTIPPTEEAVLRAWHAADPPDDRERRRDDVIERVQQRRNPFIDRPELADLIDDF